MPNWCFTNFYINPIDDTEETKAKMKDFLAKFDKWTEGLDVSDFNTKWLGNPLIASGLCEKIDGNVFVKGTDIQIPCRGSIDNTNISADGQIEIQTSTAWSWMAEAIRLLVAKEIPGSEIIFSAEETGNGIFDTNDPCLQNTYVVDIWDDKLETDEEFLKITGNDTYIYDTGVETIRKIAKYLNIKEATNYDVPIKDVISKITEHYDISINEWRMVDINDISFTDLSDEMIEEIIDNYNKSQESQER